MGNDPVSPTGIESISIERATANQPSRSFYNGIYDLQGQRVGDNLEALRKGIYIKDGKTFIKRE